MSSQDAPPTPSTPPGPGTPDADDENLTIMMKMKWFFSGHWRGVLCVVVPLLFLPFLVPPPTPKYCWVAYTLCLMACFWVTEAIPLPVTSFLPILIFPLTGVMDGTSVCLAYFNDTMIMFLGSLMLAATVEQSGLHNRLALCAVRTIGYSHYKLLFAMSFVTMFVSMWLTNTAATTMMVPIMFALLRVFEGQNLLKIYDINSAGDKVASNITCCYFCAITFSATIGGIGTLVGTVTNLVFKGLMETTYPNAPEYLTFPMFSAFAVPYMLILESCLYFSMILLFFGFLRPKSEAAKHAFISEEGKAAAKAAVERETIALGRMTYWEYNALLLFMLAIALFFTRSPQMFPGWADRVIAFYMEKNKKYIKDSAVATIVLFLMMWLPRSLEILQNCKATKLEELPKGKIRSVLDWSAMEKNLPFSFMFLLGGGFSISTAASAKYSDLNGVIGDMLSKLAFLPSSLLLLVIIVFTIALTNLASNVAVATVIVPIAMVTATRVGSNPLLFNMAAGFSASYCFMLPVGTPGNLIVASAAKISTKQMIQAGALPTLLTIFLTWGALSFWAPVVFPDLKLSYKELPWAVGARKI